MKSLRSLDITSFFFAFILLILVWEFVIGIPLTEVYGSGDFVGLVAHYSEMLRDGFLSSDFLYSPTRLGGNATGALDLPAYYQIFAALKFHPILALNLSVILTQALVFFFCYKTLLITAKSHPVITGIYALTVSFAPFIGWRIGYGHLNLLWGLLWGAGIVYLVIASREKKLSPTGITATVLVFVNSLQNINLAQPIVYGGICIVFFALFFFRKPETYWIRVSAALICCALTAFLFSANQILNIVQLTPTLGRYGSEKIIYSYVTQTVPDLLSSLFYSVNTIDTGRTSFQLHETNLAYGVLPFALLTLLCFHRRSKLLYFNLFIFSFGIVFSSNLGPVSDLILEIIPLLGRFRCPGRFFLFANYLGFVTTSYFLLSKKNLFGGWKEFAPGLVVLILAFPFTGVGADIIFLSGTLVLIGDGVIRRKLNLASLPLVLLAVHLAAFRERIPADRMSLDQFDAETTLFAKLDLPLRLTEHSSLDILSGFGYNQSAAFGFSSIDGYIYPTKRFLDFSKIFNPYIGDMTYAFHTDSTSPGFAVYQRFFNITHEVRRSADKVSKVKLRESEPFFLPEEFIVTDQLNFNLLSEFDPQKTAYLEQSPGTLQRCDGARIQLDDSREIAFAVETKASCLVVFPLQYSTFLNASSEKRSFEVLPVNGILTGVLIRNFSGTVILKAKPALGGEIYFKIAALLALILLAYFHGRQRKNDSSAALQES